MVVGAGLRCHPCEAPLAALLRRGYSNGPIPGGGCRNLNPLRGRPSGSDTFTRRGGRILSGGRRPNRAWCQPGRVPQMVRGGLPLACGGKLPWLLALGENDTFTRRPLVSVGCPN